MKTAALAILLSLVPTSQALCEDGRVSGTLSTPDGKPVIGYPVIVSGEVAGHARNWISSTNTEGKFVVEQLPAGEYTVVPANEPGAVKAFQIEPEAVETAAPDLELEVTPGDKF
jgi:hypothetical protein